MEWLADKAMLLGTIVILALAAVPALAPILI